MLIKDASWWLTTDVVVVGLGGAGAVAAITAHDLGAQVVVLEKQPKDSHQTNTSLSGGVFINVADVKKASAYMEVLCRSTNGGPPWTDTAMLDVWANHAAENVQWVESLGGKVKLWHSGGEHVDVPGVEAIESYRFAGS
ncbi:MAG: FAD-binding protein, partial [Dehalococcoidia bacterium]|nr:FAD-binding protein [Dehalococcoidia bacterium]